MTSGIRAAKPWLVGRTRRLVPSKRLDGRGLVIVWTPCYTTKRRDRFRASGLLLRRKMRWLGRPKDVKNAEREVQLDPF